MRLIEQIHTKYVSSRRARVLTTELAKVIPRDASVLDVGCGDGELTRAIADVRPDLKISGVDILCRERTAVPVSRFDGKTLPCDSRSLDVVLFVDVLHHTDDPMVLLNEAARVARRAIVIKDHMSDGVLAERTLRFMDNVGNRRFGVALPYNYWRRRQWMDVFERLNTNLDVWMPQLALYGWPAGLLFDRSLHFIARLSIPTNGHSDFVD